MDMDVHLLGPLHHLSCRSLFGQMAPSLVRTTILPRCASVTAHSKVSRVTYGCLRACWSSCYAVSSQGRNQTLLVLARAFPHSLICGDGLETTKRAGFGNRQSGFLRQGGLH